jgi:hypothetical protein
VTDSLVGAVQNAIMSKFGDNVVHDGLSDFRYANPLGDAYMQNISAVGDNGIDYLIDREIDRVLSELDL